MNTEQTTPDAAELAAYHVVCAYTLTHGDAAFVHQLVVDAWAAQHANAASKPIGVFFAVLGLYLHVEHGFTGRAVQKAHMKLAQRPEPWPVGPLPTTRGAVTATDVLAAPPGPIRDAAISRWAASVWATYVHQRDTIDALLRRRGVL
jgi:hypothetical protein